MSNFTEIYEKLSNIDVSNLIEKKNGLNYISWANAWHEVSKNYNIDYKVHYFDGKPYLFDENLGYMVKTTVSILSTTNIMTENITKEMHLFVMDGKNKAQRHIEYTYDTKYSKDNKVEPATMFDINTTIMRCLVKNIALFGFGISLYKGEDINEITNKQNKTPYNSVKQETLLCEKCGAKKITSSKGNLICSAFCWNK